MTNHIQIGKSIVKNYSDYATTKTIDDRTEYFPTLIVIIKGIIESDTDKKEQKEIEKVLIDFAKELYIKSWIKHAIEDEDSPDLDQEKEAAISEFEHYYYG